MKVKIVNVADYEIKEEKVTNIPFNTFVNLCGSVGNNICDNALLYRYY